MAIKHDLYVQLDPKDLKKGLASFFHAKTVEDGGAWNSRTRTLNSNKSDSIVVDFGEDTPYTDIFWKDKTTKKHQTPIESGKAILPLDINFNDIQLYSDNLNMLYRYDDKSNQIIQFGYEQTSYSNTKQTYIYATDFYEGYWGWPHIYYPFFQINSTQKYRNPISGYSKRFGALEKQNTDYWTLGIRDNSKIKPTTIYTHFGMLREGELGEYSTTPFFNPKTEGLQNPYLIKLSYNLETKNLIQQVFTPSWKNSKTSFSKSSAISGKTKNELDFLYNSNSVIWKKTSEKEVQLRQSTVALIVTTSAPTSMTWERDSRVGGFPGDYDGNSIDRTAFVPKTNSGDGNHSNWFSREASIGSKITAWKDLTISCGKTYGVEINLEKYPTIIYQSIDLTGSRTVQFPISFNDQNPSGHNSGRVFQAKIPTCANDDKIYCLTQSYTAQELEKLDNFGYTYIDFPDPSNIDENNIKITNLDETHTNWEYLPNLKINTGKHTLSAEVFDIETDWFNVYYKITYEIPSFYRILGLNQNFEIYKKDGYLPLELSVFDDNELVTHHYYRNLFVWFMLRYNNQPLNNYPGIGDVDFARDTLCYAEYEDLSNQHGSTLRKYIESKYIPSYIYFDNNIAVPTKWAYEDFYSNARNSVYLDTTTYYGSIETSDLNNFSSEELNCSTGRPFLNYNRDDHLSPSEDYEFRLGDLDSTPQYQLWPIASVAKENWGWKVQTLTPRFFLNKHNIKLSNINSYSGFYTSNFTTSLKTYNLYNTSPTTFGSVIIFAPGD